MKLSLSYDSDTIRNLIADDIQRKIGVSLSSSDVKILVRSKQNYREKEFEHGELKCNIEVDV
jgi:hypothetical protein